MNSFTPIENLGRNQLIDKIKQEERFKRDEVIYGIGDDAAVIRNSDFESSLISSETFVESVDFDLTIAPLHHLGYKLSMAAVSDIVAMNGLPVGITVNLALPNKVSVEMVEQFYKGVHYAGEVGQFELIGGDITATRGPLVISITAYGKADSEQITYRSGAKPDDAICVTGDLGGAIAGLRVLLREKEGFDQTEAETTQPELDKYEYVVKRQLLPNIRFDFLQLLDLQRILPSSMIDISQGLIHDLQQILTSSGVGAHIYQAAIPIATETRQVADEMETDVDRYALYGGEDFELLFTISKEDMEQLYNHFDDFSVIGKITEEKQLLIQGADGAEINIDFSAESN
ncbi:thiamine-phosphate kinase [bacterium]|nr:MAG: thiamine-phosphate kinase [bacterium]